MKMVGTKSDINSKNLLYMADINVPGILMDKKQKEMNSLFS